MRYVIIALAGLLFFQTGTLRADEQPADAAAVRAFVQAFYDWYAPKAKAAEGDSVQLVLTAKKSALSPKLFQALEADEVAQQKAKGDLVGLDFDPFLNSQDPVDHYFVGKISLKGKSYLVDIAEKESKERNPVLIAELERQGDSFVFVNFHYEDLEDLLSILKTLADDRRHEKP